jgi:hypothetical protein
VLIENYTAELTNSFFTTTMMFFDIHTICRKTIFENFATAADQNQE